jgi:hypothetical protein
MRTKLLRHLQPVDPPEYWVRIQSAHNIILFIFAWPFIYYLCFFSVFRFFFLGSALDVVAGVS